MIISKVPAAKFLLLRPELYANPNNLQKFGKIIHTHLEISQKNKKLRIEQDSHNIYTLTLRITNDSPNSENSGVSINNINGSDQPSVVMVSIDLNPEDVVIIQKYINSCLDELLIKQ